MKKLTPGKLRVIQDESTDTVVIGSFDKQFKNDHYELLFNMKTGFEVLRGINGHPDPFSLEMPSMIDCGIMGHCENKCLFCYQGDKEEPNMSLEDFKKIIDECKYHTNQTALGGRGDPNLHENFKEIMEYARNNNVVPNYTTSGQNLTQYQVDISKNLAGAVAVSDYNRNFTYRSLKMFMDANVKTNIHFILSKNSVDCAINILRGIDVWDGRVNLDKLNAVIFLLFKPQGRGKSLQWTPKAHQLYQFSKLIKDPKCKFKVGLDSCLVCKIIKYANFSPIQKMAIDTCESGRMSVYVTPDMKLVPCSFADHDSYGVSIKDEPIKEVWESSEPFIQFRESLKKNPEQCPVGL